MRAAQKEILAKANLGPVIHADELADLIAGPKLSIAAHLFQASKASTGMSTYRAYLVALEKWVADFGVSAASGPARMSFLRQVRGSRSLLASSNSRIERVRL